MTRKVLLLLIIAAAGTGMFFSITIHAAEPKTVSVAPGEDKEVTFALQDQDPQGLYTLDITPSGLKLNSSTKILGPGKSLWQGPHGLGDSNAPPTENLHEYTINCPLGQLPDGVLIKGDFKLEGEGTDLRASNQFTVDVQDTFHITSLTICTSIGDSWPALPWEQVLLRGETLRVKAEIDPPLPEGETLSIDVTARTSSTNPDGIIVRLNQIASNRSELRGSAATDVLLPHNPIDGVAEFGSADKAVGTGSNFADSDQFDLDMSATRTQRGKARNGGDETTTPPEGAVSSTFMQAAGVEYIEVVYAEGQPTEKKDKNQIENQADWFYYSGHGSHSTATVALFTPGTFGPTDAAGNWNRDLGVAIIAGCAVLDINDYNDNYGGAEHTRSPGEDWATVGPSYFLGYNYAAPLDTQGSADIIHAWYANLDTQGILDAWRIANDNSAGRNACVIDMASSPNKYYYYQRHGWPVHWYTWEVVGAPW